MARVTINLPETFSFSTELPIYISQINRGDHVGNDSMVNILNEATIRFFGAKGIADFCVHGVRLINADMAMELKAESKYGDSLLVEIAPNDFHKYGCDLVYRISSKNHGHVVALAKMGYVAFDYETGSLTEAPAGFQEFMKG